MIGAPQRQEGRLGRLDRGATCWHAGGTANFDHPCSAHLAGIGVTAELDKARRICSQRSVLAVQLRRMDPKGADVNVVIVRTAPSKGGKHGLSGMPHRAAPGLRFEQPISKIGISALPEQRSSSRTAVRLRRTCSRRATATSSSPRTSPGGLGGGHRRGRARSAYEYVLKCEDPTRSAATSRSSTTRPSAACRCRHEDRGRRAFSGRRTLSRSP